METPQNDKKQPEQNAESTVNEAQVSPESNEETSPSQEGASARGEKKDSEGMSLKDKLSLIISGIALVVSMAGFFYPIYRSSAQEVKAQRRARAHAYNLGIAFTLAYVGFTQTTEGTPAEIANAKESAKTFLDQNTREIATALGLNPDLKIYLVEPKPGEIFEVGPFQSLREKISYFNTEETVAAYNVGHGLTYLGVESQYAKELDKQEDFAKRLFPLYRELINRNLKILGVNQKEMMPEFDTLENVTRRSREMRDKYDVEFGGGQ